MNIFKEIFSYFKQIFSFSDVDPSLKAVTVFYEEPLQLLKFDDFRDKKNYNGPSINRYILSSLEDPNIGLVAYEEKFVSEFIFSLFPKGSVVWFYTFYDEGFFRYLKKTDIEYYYVESPGVISMNKSILFMADSPMTIEKVGWPNIYGFAGTELFVITKEKNEQWGQYLKDTKLLTRIDTRYLMGIEKILNNCLCYMHAYGGEENDLAIYTKSFLKDELLSKASDFLSKKGFTLYMADGGLNYWEKKRIGPKDCVYELYQKPSTII